MSSKNAESKKGVSDEPDGPVELLISRLLRIGVTVSLIIIVLGIFLIFNTHPNYLNSSAVLKRLISPGAAFPKTLKAVSQGLLIMQGKAVVMVELLLLMLTPILRVAMSMVLFILQRDLRFTLITGTGLIVLMISFLLGKMG
jgi:uncharacterized membrane protein